MPRGFLLHAGARCQAFTSYDMLYGIGCIIAPFIVVYDYRRSDFREIPRLSIQGGAWQGRHILNWVCKYRLNI